MGSSRPRLQILLSTINSRFPSVEGAVRLKHPDLAYIIVHQHRDHSDDDRIIGLKRALRCRPDIRIIESKSSGLAKSRNLCIENATAEIVLIGDDDVQYSESLVETVLGAFDETPCDVATFMFESSKSERKRHHRRVSFKHGPISILGVSSIEIAFRLSAIRENAIRFDERFGIGAHYPISEEAVFLQDCRKSGLRVFFVPETIATHGHESSGNDWGSTSIWFSKGAVFRRMYGYPGIAVLFVMALQKYPLYKKHYNFFDFCWNNMVSFIRFR